jgi:putative intracellular protease/amidase
VPSVLMVLSGARTWTMKDGTAHPTGFWVEEFVRPHQTFTEAGLDVTVATPGGRTPVGDELSLSLGYNNDDPDEVAFQRAYLAEHEQLLASTLPLEQAHATDYDVLFVAGGHGPMQDLPVDPSIGPLMVEMLDDQDKIVCAVCHGSASFLSAARPDGSWLFEGRELTGFTNEEETQASFAGNAVWLLEDRLRRAGAHFSCVPAWGVHVVVDGNLVTGQNWESAVPAAEAIVEQLKVAA